MHPYGDLCIRSWFLFFIDVYLENSVLGGLYLMYALANKLYLHSCSSDQLNMDKVLRMYETNM